MKNSKIIKAIRLIINSISPVCGDIHSDRNLHNMTILNKNPMNENIDTFVIILSNLIFIDWSLKCYFFVAFHCRYDTQFHSIVGLQFIFGVVLNSNTLSDCTPFSSHTTLLTTLSRLTHNGMAAWRSGGFHKISCGLQTFNSALPFLRAYCRRCAKPHSCRLAFCPLFLLQFTTFTALFPMSCSVFFCHCQD